MGQYSRRADPGKRFGLFRRHLEFRRGFGGVAAAIEPFIEKNIPIAASTSSLT